MSNPDKSQEETAKPMFTIVDHDNNLHGPVEAGTIRKWLAEGRVSGKTWTRKAGAEDWRTLDFFPQFPGALAPGEKNDPQVSRPPSEHPLLRRQKTNGTAIAGMVLGILSILSLYPVLGFPCNLIGIITSSVALKQIKRNPPQHGRGMALAGLVCSIISAVIALLVIGVILIVISTL